VWHNEQENNPKCAYKLTLNLELQTNQEILNQLQTKGINNQVTNQQHCVSECYPLLKIKTHTKCNEFQDDKNYYYEKKQPQRELATD